MAIASTVTPLDAAAILIALAATLGYLNQRYLRLPPSIGMTAMGAVASLIVVALDRLLPGNALSLAVVATLQSRLSIAADCTWH